MCQALLEIMEPEINEIVESKIQEEVQKEIQKSILIAVKGFRDLGADNGKIKGILMSNYELTPKEAEQYLKDSNNDI